jgi:hypothetical protein
VEEDIHDSDSDDDDGCKIPRVSSDDRVENKDQNYYRGANSQQKTAGLKIFQKKIEYYGQLIKKFEGNRNEKCKYEAIKRMKEYIDLNSDLHTINEPQHLNTDARSESTPTEEGIIFDELFEKTDASNLYDKSYILKENETRKIDLGSLISSSKVERDANKYPHGDWLVFRLREGPLLNVYKKNDKLEIRPEGENNGGYDYNIDSRFFENDTPAPSPAPSPALSPAPSPATSQAQQIEQTTSFGKNEEKKGGKSRKTKRNNKKRSVSRKRIKNRR